MAQTHATDLPTACRHLLYFSVGLKILIFPCDGTKYVVTDADFEQ
jgi:hypothetical protein